MISSVSIQSFKSFKSLQDFSLRPLNVLVGPNRSGKTNFLDFWDLLSQAGMQQLAQAISKRGGIDSVIGWNQNPTFQYELHFEAQEPFSQENEIYYLAQIAKQQLTYSVIQERLIKKAGTIESSANDLELLNISSGRGFIYNESTEANQQHEGWIKTTDLVVTQIRDNSPIDATAYSTMNKVRRYLANISVHRFFNTDEDSPIRNAQLVGVSDAEFPPTRLSRRGDNLTNALYFMHNDLKYQDYYEEYLITLKRAFPSFERLFFPADAGQGKTIMAWQDRNFEKRLLTANLLTDGVLRFMCLLAALYDPNPPSLLCFDEPEIGLHPQLVRLLVSVLQEVSERVQIIVTTHSPELISYLENADDVVVVEAEEGWSTLRRLSQNELQHWLEKYSLGELWMSGEIGGRL